MQGLEDRRRYPVRPGPVPARAASMARFSAIKPFSQAPSRRSDRLNSGWVPLRLLGVKEGVQNGDTKKYPSKPGR
jgi:hypothetical protein